MRARLTLREVEVRKARERKGAQIALTPFSISFGGHHFHKN